MTKGEVYDFEIGDEFHYQYDTYGMSTPLGFQKTIINKTFNSFGDTLTYIIDSMFYTSTIVDTPSPHLVYNVSYYTDTIVFSNLDSLNQVVDTIVGDTLFYNIDSLCNRQIDVFDYYNNYMSGGDIEYLNKYGRGLGHTYFHEWASGTAQPYFKWYLSYYKKGIDSCGTPYIVSVKTKKYNNRVKVFPIPASSHVNIKLKDNFVTLPMIYIYDITGVQVLSKKMKSESETLNLATLPKGIYVMKLESKEFTLRKKIIIK